MQTSELPHHQFLRRIHVETRPNSYLEIGVETGATLNLATCPAVGVDPAPLNRTFTSPNIKLFEMASDDFFANHDVAAMFPNGIDFAFIDGMHLFEFALRDFMNIERHSNKNSLVALHDCCPPHPEWAERERKHEAWCGDVWKLLLIFNRYRPELDVKVYDCPPSGVVLVSGLSRGNRVFAKHFEEIVRKFEPLSLQDYGLRRLQKAFPATPTQDAKLRYRFSAARA